MVVDRVLTAQERRKSQMVMRDHSILSSLAGGCGSEALLVLTALTLGVSNTWVSACGSFTYFSYAFLPFGILVTARLGVEKSIGLFLTMTAGIYLVIAGMALSVSGGCLLIFLWVMLHILRSCSASMMFPLQKNITTDEERPGMFARNNAAGMITGLGTALLVAWLLSLFPANPLIPILFTGSCIFYLCVCGNIRRIIIPASLKRMANHKLLTQALIAWRVPHIRHQVYVGCAMNLFLALMLQINVLTLKNAYHAADSMIVLLGAIQTVSSVATLAVYKKVTLRFGAANVLLWICPAIWLFFAYWLFAPQEMTLVTAMPPFILLGMIHIAISTGLGNYFADTVDNAHQIGGSFWVFTGTGGLMGVMGMFLNPLIFKGIEVCGISGGISTFRAYFVVTAILFSGLFLAPLSLVRRKAGRR